MLFTPRQKGLGSDNFLKLNDKEEVAGYFTGEIYKFKRHWSNNKGIECTGAETCPICRIDSDNYPAFRFRINFVTTKDGQWVAKIFEGGGETYDQLTTLDRKYDLTTTAVEITRHGLKQNTKYMIMPLVNQPLTKEMESKIKSVSLQPLSASMGELA
jgi:hypothetical protein